MTLKEIAAKRNRQTTWFLACSLASNIAYDPKALIYLLQQGRVISAEEADQILDENEPG